MRLHLAFCLPLVCLFVVTVSELAEPSNDCEGGICPQEDSSPIQIQRVARGHSNVHAARPVVRHAARPAHPASRQVIRPVAHQVRRPVAHPSARQVRHPASHQARRPVARRAPVHQARRPAARHAPVHQARRPAARRAPVHQARRPAPRRPAPRSRPQPRANQAEGGKPIGPNQIRLPPGTVAIKELMLATSKAKEVSAKFSKIKGNANTIMNGMNEVSKLMDEESGTANHIQMRMAGVRSKFLSGWMDKAKSVASSMKDMMNDVKEATDQAKSVLELINKHKNSIKGKDNFSKTIASFAVDFGKHVEDGEQIQKDMEPATSTLSIVVSGSGGDISSIKIKFSGALEAFKKIKVKVETTSDSLIKVTIDLQNSVNEGGKNGDVPAAREPETSKPRKPEDNGDKPKPKPDNGGDKPKPKPDNGGDKPKPKPDNGGDKPKPKPEEDTSPGVAFECNDGKFLSSDNTADRLLTCNSDKKSEYFHVKPLNSGDATKVSLHSKDSKKFCSLIESPNSVVCTRDKIDAKETFIQEKNNDGTFSFKCSNGDYLTNPGGAKALTCSGKKIEEQQKFKPVPETKDDDKKGKETKITFSCKKGGFVGGADIKNGVDCSKTKKEDAEEFTVVELADGKHVNLKSKAGQFCSSKDAGKLKCTETKGDSDTEKFEQIKNPSGTLSFKCSNKKYLSVQADKTLACTLEESKKVTEAEEFEDASKVVPPTPAKETKITFSCKSGGFAGGADVKTAVDCSKTKKEDGTEFIIVELPDGKHVNLKAGGQFCSSKDAGKLKCTETKGDADTEKFEQIKNPDNSLTFKCNGDKLLSIQADKTLACTVAGATPPTDNEKFEDAWKITPPAPAKETKLTFSCKPGGFVGGADLKTAVDCSKTKKEDAEEITVVELPDGKHVNLKSKTGEFCSSKDAGKLKCTEAKGDGVTEQFVQVKNADGTLSFKCDGDKLLSIQADKSLACTVAGATPPTDAEKFEDASKVVPPAPAKETKLTFSCKSGGFVGGADLKTAVDCSKTKKEDAEEITIVELADGKHVNLKSKAGQFCSSKDAGKLKCTEAKGDGATEQFQQITNPDKTLSFKCDGDKLLSIQADKSLACTVAGATPPTDAEKFEDASKVVPPAPAKETKLTFSCKPGGFAGGTDLKTGVDCSKTKKEDAEEFTLVELADGKHVNLKAGGQFCSSKDAGKLKCTEPKGDGATEQFVQVKNADGTLSFKCDGDKLLSIQADKTLACTVAGATPPSDNEKFDDASKVVPPAPAKETKMGFACKAGGFAAALGSDAKTGIDCSKTKKEEAEEITIVELPDGTHVNLKVGGQFCSSKDAGKLKCTEVAPGTDDEKFEQIKNPDGTLSFKCNGNKLLSVQAADKTLACTVAGATPPSDNEKFSDASKFVPPAPAKETKLTFSCKSGGFVGGADLKTGVDCSKTKKEDAEQITIVELADGTHVNLKSKTGEFCSSKDAGKLKCTEAKGDGATEQFQQITNPDNTLSFKCDGDKLLSIQADKTLACTVAGATPPTDAEKFEDASKAPVETKVTVITLACPDGTSFVASETTADKKLDCKKKAQADALKFEVEEVDGGAKIALKVMPLGKYCSDTGDATPMKCEKDGPIGDTEKFTQKEDSGKVTFQCSNNNYITIDSDNLVCKSPTAEDSTKFKFDSKNEEVKKVTP